MKVEAKDLVVGNEYWFNEEETAYGAYLGYDEGYHFTDENTNGFLSNYKDRFGMVTVPFPKFAKHFYLKTDNTKEGLLTKAQQQIEEAKKQIAEANELIQKANELIKQNEAKSEDDVYFDREKLISIMQKEKSISIRGGGEFREKSFYLSPFYNWEIKKDSEGILCLIPTKKK